MKATIHSKFIKFLAGGGINTAASYAIYLALNLFLDYKLAYSISYAIGIGISYVINALWVFKAPLKGKSAVLFPLVYLIQYLISISLMKAFVSTWSIPEAVAPIITIITVIPITFLLTKIILEKRQQ